MLIYRFENNKGCGPYQILDKDGYYLVKSLEKHGHDDDGDHPNLFEDQINPFQTVSTQSIGELWKCGLYNVRFGFRTLQQAYQWFTPSEVLGMAQYGITMEIYDVPDEFIIIYGHQVVFNKEKAVKVGG